MALTVTVQPDAHPPRVKIETNGVVVTRTDEAGVSVRVRDDGVNGVIDGVIYDHELGQGVPVTYSNDIGDVSPLVQMPDVGTWLIHLSRPELSVPLVMKGEDEVSLPARVSSVRTFSGRPFSVSVGERDSVSSGLSVYALDEEAHTDLRALIHDQSVLFLSSTNSGDVFDYVGPRYVRILDVTIARTADRSQDPRRVLSLPYLVQDRPVSLVSGAVGWDLMPTSWAGMPVLYPGMPS